MFKSYTDNLQHKEIDSLVWLFAFMQGSFKWDSTYQKDYPHYMILQTKLQHAGHWNTNVCTGHCFCRHAHLSNQWQFFLRDWLNQPIVSQSSSISCSVDILWMTFPMFISLVLIYNFSSLTSYLICIRSYIHKYLVVKMMDKVSILNSCDKSLRL